MQFVVLAVFVALIALVWVAVMRWLKNDGVPVRASLEEDGSIQKWSAAQKRREPVSHTAPGGGLDRAKDRNVGQTWGPGL